jgi:hypothetical protein
MFRTDSEKHAMEHNATSEEPTIARTAAIGALIGFLLVAVVYGGISLFAGSGNEGAMGIAVFAGIWGGPGFGAMMGAVVAAHSREDRHRPLRPHHVAASQNA